MGDPHVRKSLIPNEKPAPESGKPKSAAKGTDSSGRVRVIAITGVFVLLLAAVAYSYRDSWLGEPKIEDVMAEEIAPQGEPPKPKAPHELPDSPELPPDPPGATQG